MHESKTLWFDRHDVDARKLLTQMCQKWDASDGTVTVPGFTATDRSGEKIIIDKNYVTKNLGELVKDTDLSKFIL